MSRTATSPLFRPTHELLATPSSEPIPVQVVPLARAWESWLWDGSGGASAPGTARCEIAPGVPDPAHGRTWTQMGTDPLGCLRLGGVFQPAAVLVPFVATPPLEPWAPTEWVRQPGDLPVAVQSDGRGALRTAGDALRPGGIPEWTIEAGVLHWLGRPQPDASRAPIAPAITRADSLAGCEGWPAVARTLRDLRTAGERHRSRVWATLRAAAAVVQPRGWVTEGWDWAYCEPADTADPCAEGNCPPLDILTSTAALIALDLHGVGGPGGYSGGATTRMAWARGLGSGRWQARDGAAWRAASVAALDILRGGISREYPDADPALIDWRRGGKPDGLIATPAAVRSILSGVDGPRPWDLEWLAAYSLWVLAQAEPWRTSSESLQPWADLLTEIAGHVRAAQARYPGADCVKSAHALLQHWGVEVSP